MLRFRKVKVLFNIRELEGYGVLDLFLEVEGRGREKGRIGGLLSGRCVVGLDCGGFTGLFI